MLAGLVGRKLLLKQIHQGIVEAVLVEVGAGNARRVIGGTQIVHFADLGAVLGPGDGGGIARLGRQLRLGGEGGNGGHTQHKRHSADRENFFHLGFLLTWSAGGKGAPGPPGSHDPQQFAHAG